MRKKGPIFFSCKGKSMAEAIVHYKVHFCKLMNTAWTYLIRIGSPECKTKFLVGF